MPDSYSILEIAEEYGRDVNEIFLLIRDKKIKLENGKIPSSSLSIIKKALGIERDKKRPDEKVSRRHNPSAIHQYIDYDQLDAFIEMLEESGEDLSKMPRGYVFGGLVHLMKNGIIERQFKNDSIESVVADFYPLEANGNAIPDNIWLVKGAETYRRWSEKTRSGVKKLVENSTDDLEFTYKMRKADSDIAIAAAVFLRGVESKGFIRIAYLEKFKWLANGLLLYKNLDENFKKKLFEAYKENYKRPMEFSYWLFTEYIFIKMQEKTKKKIRDDNSYMAAIIFSIKDLDPSFKLSLEEHQSFQRYYAAFSRMQVFKEKGDTFYKALNRIKKDIESSKKNEKNIDVDLFIANTLQNGTYRYFYENYCGRGIQYSTFVSYAAAALLLESKDNPKNRLYGEILSKVSKERKVEKVDRLRGKSGRTSLVDLCKQASYPKDLYDYLKATWKTYRKTLQDEGCWLKGLRSESFSQREVNGMYELVQRFPKLFD